MDHFLLGQPLNEHVASCYSWWGQGLDLRCSRIPFQFKLAGGIPGFIVKNTDGHNFSVFYLTLVTDNASPLPCPNSCLLLFLTFVFFKLVVSTIFEELKKICCVLIRTELNFYTNFGKSGVFVFQVMIQLFICYIIFCPSRRLFSFGLFLEKFIS